MEQPLQNLNHQSAFILVKTGLESGAIKLIGTHSVNNAEETGSADALYLLTLINKLTKGLPAT